MALRRVLVVLCCAAVLLGACATPPTPKAEVRAMVAELHAQGPQLQRFAHLSSEAYLTPAESKRCPRVMSFKAGVTTECFTAPVSAGYSAVYLLETNNVAKEQVIAIRGTASPNDWITDGRVQMVHDDTLGVDVHAGFRQFARAILTDVKPRLKPGYRVTTTGHSLGGAGALLVALYLYADPENDYHVAGVYTFGQPKVFANDGATAWPFFSRRVYRVVHCGDVVASVPPFDYQHIGQSILLVNGTSFWMPGSIDVEQNIYRNAFEMLRDGVEHQPIAHGINVYSELINAIVAAPENANPVRGCPPSSDRPTS